MSLASGFHNDFGKFLADLGQAMTLQRRVAGTYDPTTGTTSSDTSTDYTGTGRLGSYSDKVVDGTVIKESDRLATFQSDDATLVPLVGDRLVVGADTYTVVNFKTREIGGDGCGLFVSGPQVISANTAQFTLDLKAWADRAKGNLREFAVETIQDINEAIVEGTPVKTGFLRASWYANLNGDAVGTSGQGNVANVNLVAADLKLGDVYYMNNGAAYAMRVEFGFVGTDSLGRTYNQPPRAFVRSVLDRAPSIAEAAAQRVGGQ